MTGDVIKRLRGIGSYIINIASKVAEILYTVQFIIIVNTKAPKIKKEKLFTDNIELLKLNKNIKIIDIAHYNDTYVEQILIPRFCNKFDISLFHSPANRMSFFPNVKTVVTVHDIIELKYIEKICLINKIHLNLKEKFYNFRKRFFINYLYFHHLKKAAGILTVSNSSKNDLVNFCSISGRKIFVIPISYDSVNYYKPEVECERNGILMLGSDAEHKNVSAMIESYSILPENLKQQHELIIVEILNWLEKI